MHLPARTLRHVQEITYWDVTDSSHRRHGSVVIIFDQHPKQCAEAGMKPEDGWHEGHIPDVEILETQSLELSPLSERIETVALSIPLAQCDIDR